MKKIELMERLEKFNKTGDLIITDWGKKISVDIYDFEGFDENWDEISRDIEMDVEEFIKFLQENSNSYEKNFYSTYNFEDCLVKLGRTSYDI